MEGPDETNCRILNLLQEDCRMSLTDMAAKVGLSVDSTRKRLAKLKTAGYFFPKIQLRPRHFGYPYIVDVKVTLRNHTEQDAKAFVDYLMKHPRVAELFALSGTWDYTIVLIAKDHEDLATVSGEIRGRFAKIIDSWTESLTTIAYKFETYDLLALSGRDGGAKE